MPIHKVLNKILSCEVSKIKLSVQIQESEGIRQWPIYDLHPQELSTK